MVKIEKGIPLPTAQSKYPFATMEIGDSFAVEIKSDAAPSRVSTYAHVAGKRLGMKFTVRTVTEGSKKMIRVWRTQ